MSDSLESLPSDGAPIASPPRTAEQERLIAERVRADRLRLLFRQSFIALIGSFISAVILSLLCWERAEPRELLTWLAALGGATLLRLGLFALYWRQPQALRTPQRWERPYWATLLLSASIWGFGALWVMPEQDPLAQAVTLFFTIGMAGSALSTYAVYRSMTLSAIGLVLLPCSLWLALQPEIIPRGMAIAALLFSASAVRATRELSESLEKALRLSHELELAHRIASHAAQTDELTGLNNRRAFFERAGQLFDYCRRHRRTLFALVLDVDHFKRINDCHGHPLGDQALRRIGALLGGSFRQADVCGRLGGEEFAVLLADAGAQDALQIAEQLRQAIADIRLALPSGEELRLSASLGLTELRDDDRDLGQLLQRADQAMYQAKAQGRDRVAQAS